MKKNENADPNLFETPCEDKKIIKLLIESLISSYESLGHQDKVDDLNAIAELL